MKKRRAILFIAFLLVFMGLGLLPIQAETPGSVYIISVQGEITPAMSTYLSRHIKNAQTAGAVGIVIDIGTLGGRADAALEMRDAILYSEVPTAVFVRSRATSAGALIAIASETILMAPGSQMGSAEPIPFSEKALAVVGGAFRSTAEAHGRDPKIAEGMVDRSLDVAGFGPDRLVDLTAEQALSLGYANAIVRNIPEVLEFMGWAGARIVEVEPDFGNRIAQFLTRAEISSILLSIGMIAILAEIYTQGFGAAGIIGLSAFALYFGGGLLAGSSEWWAAALFIGGIVLLLIEATMPGFGIFGLSGIGLVVVSIIFAAPDPRRGFISLSVALATAVVATPIMFKIFGRSRILERLVLVQSETVDQGYVSARGTDALMGAVGKTVTPMRPSGTILVDGRRLDALSEGGYLQPGTAVRIIQVEGSKIIVAEEEG